MYQQIDVWVNKPLRSKMGDLCKDWVDTENLKDAAEIPIPTHELVGSWAVECYCMLDNKKYKNAWKKKGFQWVIN